MSDRRIGVYICHCGGNISDYVDVDRVVKAVCDEPGVVVARTAVFTCSDATQQEMIQDIKEQNLDGLVVASCSPKLHLYTFRDVAKRAGLNPYQYTQVNIREQCSWAHTGDREGATKKAIRLVRAGIARTNLTEPLQPVKIDTVPGVLIIGAGIAGLRAAIGLADIGICVYLVERAPAVGGWVARFGKMYPHGKKGRELIDQLVDEVKKRENITLFTNAGVVEKSGSIGDFHVKIRIKEPAESDVGVRVGAIIVATGFDPYQPREGEYGYGLEGVITLAAFQELLDSSDGRLVYNGREIKDVVYIYCVGSRQGADMENANRYCSRYCCNATIHAANLAFEKNPKIHQFHLFRDIRTYGKFELLYQEALKRGAAFLKFDENEPPRVEQGGNGKLKVTVKDLLTFGEEFEIRADLVVLATGMVPKKNGKLVDTLKLPVGRDGFFNEIHPKLRPVETVVDGVFICGACQGPKNSSESVASALAAVTQSASILKKGYVELDPLIANVDPQLCTWCGVCAQACPYSAIEQEQYQGREVARVNEAVCKGCGGCVPTCSRDALNLRGYTDAQIKSMIDGLIKEIC
ncbi:CoB--CoM heterodisulfide reductase iron-sulfur subunit A family protein [Desulfofundulus salinus]|uniref:CoB--CoM heterodisulfide reductase iron-sulfur subunit A family protein n=1 Tax=Desulfofundulus salinus TaxID=2419843 RepID=A0A494WYR7_9FIRM|nr:CoB--CoM heterodisulfide reductase iron-sulfur subunit A family protein [Desulfofundulus salinum]RKO66055.1 CoB--CoM heterodisulfide reductase iron-sulfur subunit A family protein [Desulfofundulus salinum]